LPARCRAAASRPLPPLQRELWTAVAAFGDAVNPGSPHEAPPVRAAMGRWARGRRRAARAFQSPPTPHAQPPEPLVGPAARASAAEAWNAGVDAVFGPAVRALSKRGL
jgi:hypothetical protein